MLSAFSGGICEIEILQAINFAGNIQLILKYSISIVLPRSSRSNWMAVNIIIVRARFAIERGRNSSLVRELLCCDSGIIRFGKNSRAFCRQSGLHSRRGVIPHLNPLPLAKGEANFIPRSFARE